MEEVEVFISDNLWPCDERSKALDRYTETFLWARYCAEMHGLK